MKGPCPCLTPHSRCRQGWSRQRKFSTLQERQPYHNPTSWKQGKEGIEREACLAVPWPAGALEALGLCRHPLGLDLSSRPPCNFKFSRVLTLCVFFPPRLWLQVGLCRCQAAMAPTPGGRNTSGRTHHSAREGHVLAVGWPLGCKPTPSPGPHLPESRDSQSLLAQISCSQLRCCLSRVRHSTYQQLEARGGHCWGQLTPVTVARSQDCFQQQQAGGRPKGNCLTCPGHGWCPAPEPVV